MPSMEISSLKEVECRPSQLESRNPTNRSEEPTVPKAGRTSPVETGTSQLERTQARPSRGAIKHNLRGAPSKLLQIQRNPKFATITWEDPKPSAAAQEKAQSELKWSSESPASTQVEPSTVTPEELHALSCTRKEY